MTNHWWFVDACSLLSRMGPSQVSTGSQGSLAATDSPVWLVSVQILWLNFFLVVEQTRSLVWWLKCGVFILKDSWKTYIIIFFLHFLSSSYLCIIFNITLPVNYLAAIGCGSLSNFIYSIPLAPQYFKHLPMSKVPEQNYLSSLLGVTH